MCTSNELPDEASTAGLDGASSQQCYGDIAVAPIPHWDLGLDSPPRPCLLMLEWQYPLSFFDPLFNWQLLIYKEQGSPSFTWKGGKGASSEPHGSPET